MKVVTTAQMRQMEERSVAAGVSLNELMESAGLAVARRITQLLDGVRGKRVIVLVGAGNNGGDGMVAARYLSDWGALVTLYMTAAQRREDQFGECRSRRIRVVEAQDDLDQWALSSYLPLTDLLLDAVLGLGRDRPLDGALRDLFSKLCEAKAAQPNLQVVSVDVPTGVNADTGEVDEMCPQVDMTITLGAPKVGLYRFPAAEYVGQVETVDIGLPEGVDEGIALELASDARVASLLPIRPLDGHKSSFGRVLVVAGSRQFVGASVLACAAAYRSGAGLVSLATPEGAYRLAAAQMLEATYVPLAETALGTVAPQAAVVVREALTRAGAAVVGPGLGTSDEVLGFVQSVLLVEPPLSIPLVIDADALNALARTSTWWERLQAQAVLTPHPGELSRLLHSPVEEIQHDRVNTAQRASERWGQVVVLKGAYTVVAAPDGRTTISPFANPALASAGTGDVLSGVIGALLAQGLGPYDAAVAGVHLHALAGEQLREEMGDSGLLASDLLPVIPRIMKTLRERV